MLSRVALVKKPLLIFSLISIFTSSSLHAEASANLIDEEYIRSGSETYADIYCKNYEYGGIDVLAVATTHVEQNKEWAKEDPSADSKNDVLLFQRAKQLASERGCLSCKLNYSDELLSDMERKLVAINRRRFPCPNNQ